MIAGAIMFLAMGPSLCGSLRHSGSTTIVYSVVYIKKLNCLNPISG